MTHDAAPFLGLAPHDFGLPESLADDIVLVDTLLGQVLHAQEDAALLAIARRLYVEEDGEDPQMLLERIPELKDARLMQRLLRAYTVLFQLINTAEQKEIVRVNCERQARAGGALRSESIAEAVHALREAGAPAGEVQQLIDRLDICPTLTAHPSEARRRSVLDKLETIAQALVERSLPAAAPRLGGPLSSAGRGEQQISRALTALWQTDELRATPLTVADEAGNALYFFERSILDIVPWLHEDLRAALRENYPDAAFEIGPFVRYRSWVGGDRDGNPNVTADVTWETLTRHKARILRHYVASVEALRRELTQSARLVAASEALLESLDDDRKAISLPEERLRRYTLEPYGLKLLYVQTRLSATLEQLNTITGFRAQGISADRAPAYRDAEQFLGDLRLVQESLRQNRGALLADAGPLAHLITQAMTFGFHLATLDVRQHSDEHAQALEEMIAAAGILPADRAYGTLSEEEKVKLLRRELSNPRPLLAHNWSASPHVQSVLEVFEVVRQAQRNLSRAAVASYVISMTHGVSDILEVLLLAKEAGLVRSRVGEAEPRMESDLDVVPLFETIEDLKHCDALMRRLFADPAYRLHLEARGTFQEIMLGYSDSSKDGGFLAANATLYDTQARLADVCRAARVNVRFFHGRGGTVGRGGGRANRAIVSQPPGSFNGAMRFTEQGEVISFRYSVPSIGHRHMEQIMSAALLASSARTAQQRVRREWRAAMQDMAGRSLKVYRELVHEDPEFWDFYRQATPIQYVSRLPIASRPASRTRQPAGLEALRAIPWVFAWVQSRYVIPGWYGIGSALEAYAGQAPEKLALLTSMYRDWLFFRMVVNNAQLELLRAHLPTAAWYARRVQPAELGRRIHERIAQEHERSRSWILRITEQPDLLEHARVVRHTVELRNPTMRPLSKLQVAVMNLLEQEDERGGKPDAAWQEAMLLSITGIAAAMQSTG